VRRAIAQWRRRTYSKVDHTCSQRTNARTHGRTDGRTNELPHRKLSSIAVLQIHRTTPSPRLPEFSSQRRVLQAEFRALFEVFGVCSEDEGIVEGGKHERRNTTSDVDIRRVGKDKKEHRRRHTVNQKHSFSSPSNILSALFCPAAVSGSEAESEKKKKFDK